jgi:hypothetical protein
MSSSTLVYCGCNLSTLVSVQRRTSAGTRPINTKIANTIEMKVNAPGSRPYKGDPGIV